ncbi:TetR family transcriptional regulator C-terminal domain-containing protein [Pedobacter sp.]|jgi:TetR/AcrR family transcriptional repressor of nem operon|uniref:TetR family transcriptional regulator C-terminal domain-containing protein n=1 Tax=Pedobacter sp. TaxID=1411316 RepID=UPI002C8AE86C|nr:TetR family transcriptional regulator C-terminal domain-containing protein [Pedobacter sp.]HWW38662.1 TetR family transcriptional regulator C-terminal domain-containing protein [Pedobacter sp.]
MISKAANTKKLILTKSLELIYKKGYQATSIDDIIATNNLNEPIKKALNRLIQRVQQALELALTNAQNNNDIRKDVDPRRVAIFLLTGYSGVRNMGKVLGKESYIQFLRELKIYLNNLK